jgi:hypothetical protein
MQSLEMMSDYKSDRGRLVFGPMKSSLRILHAFERSASTIVPFLTKKAVSKVEFVEIYEYFKRVKNAIDCERRIKHNTGHVEFFSKNQTFRDLVPIACR